MHLRTVAIWKAASSPYSTRPRSALVAMQALEQPLAKRSRFTKKAPEWLTDFCDSLGQEQEGTNLQVYLVTFSRVFAGTAVAYRDLRTVTKPELAVMVRDALENPIAPSRGGRPRASNNGDDTSLVELVAVAQEEHRDGSPHFHVALRLVHRMRFKPAKGMKPEH